MKRVLAVILSFLFVMMFTFPVFAGDGTLFEDENNRVVNEEYFADEKSIQTLAQDNDKNMDKSGFPVKINAKSAVLMDVVSGKILLEYNSHEKMPPASVTKIMSLLLYTEAIERGEMKLGDTVTTSREASKKGGSQIWLKEGETMTVDELLKATFVSSANDACTALAEKLCGSEESFVALMNKRAAELKMNDTVFENCTGLDDNTTNHLTSANDIALMSRELLKHESIQKYTTIWMDSIRGGKTELVNTNKLVRFYKGTTGLKTGTTSKAGHCLSASAKRGDMHLVAVVLGSESGAARFESAKNMLNYGFANWKLITPEPDMSLITPVTVLKGLKKEIMPSVGGCGPVLVKTEQEKSVTQEISLAQNIEAPVEEGQTLGRIVYKIDGEKVGESLITAPESVEVLNFRRALVRVLCSMS